MCTLSSVRLLGIPFIKWLVVIAALFGSSCAGMKDADGSSMIINRRDVESWNWEHVWVPSSTNPHWCIPRDLKPGSPVDDEHGHWVIDPVDRWRFYVPDGGTPHYPRGRLEAWALIATNLLPDKEPLIVRLLDAFFNNAPRFGI